MSNVSSCEIAVIMTAPTSPLLFPLQFASSLLLKSRDKKIKVDRLERISEKSIM